MGKGELIVIAAELLTQVRKSVTINWTMRESAGANIKVMVKRSCESADIDPLTSCSVGLRPALRAVDVSRQCLPSIHQTYRTRRHGLFSPKPNSSAPIGRKCRFYPKG